MVAGSPAAGPQEEKEEPLGCWGVHTLAMAKAIGKGDKVYVVDVTADDFAANGMQSDEFKQGLTLVNLRENPVIEVVGNDDAKHHEYVATETRRIDHDVERAEATLAKADAKLAQRGRPPASGSLYEVLDAFRDKLPKADGSISDYGKTKQRQAKALKDLLPDVALSQLDQDACEKLYKTLRERPTKADGSHYSKKYCQHLISCLNLALEAADTGEQFRWELPQKFHRIKTKVARVDADDHKHIEIPNFTINDCASCGMSQGPKKGCCWPWA